ncbi:unnamed protein product [Larinioides sclopetarius]|uniref:C-type lectin domain-containing protein n=1 Tax=Larinioides sclopetarius TaxID=280406 RepID=A0AAV2BKV5_9ARAC
MTDVETCPRGWLSYQKECLFIKSNAAYSSHDANILCILRYRGRTVSVSSEEMLEYLSIKTYQYKDSNFWVGGREKDGVHTWVDGVPMEHQPWVQRNNSIPGSCYIYTGAGVKNEKCDAHHGFICTRNKTQYNPTEKCLEGVTEHSFIGGMTGNCLYRTPDATTKENADAKCAEHGGHFLDLPAILMEGLSAFNTHKVMVNDSLKYWTALQLNGTTVVTTAGEPLYGDALTFNPGRGDCITVSFNMEDVLKTQLYQTECKDHAYVICWARAINSQVTTLAAPLQQQILSCPVGQNWKEYPATNACYWETSFETTRLSWYDAQKYCQAFGGDLASFHSSDEEKIGLSFQYRSLSHPYWIGLHLDPVTETYKWSDGSPLDYENWAPGHPDHRDKRLRCVAMNADEAHWISSLCGIVSWFVCKAPKRPNPPTPVIPTREPLVPCDNNLGVPHSFYYWKGYCYEVVTQLFSWHRAKEYCENRESSLASIHSDDEIGFLLRLIYDSRSTTGNRVWIGLNSFNRGSFAWTDYSPVDFTYWNENEPNNHGNQEKCVNMYIGNGLWNDENCNIFMGFICKQNKDANVSVQVPTTRDPSIGNCKKGWYAHHDRCYLPVGYAEKDKLNWTDASKKCTDLGGFLVSIPNAREQAFLSYLIQGLKDDVWIGLYDTLQSGRYYWVDNSDMRYSNWAPGEPSFFGIQEDCVKMSYNELNSGVWRDDVCSMKFPYICQMDKDPDLPKPDYNRGLDCIYPEGWLKLENMCFKMFAGIASTWETAEAICERQGAQLVSLSGTSVQAIASYLGWEVNQTYWIGLRYEKKTQQFNWLNGWPMTISKWGRNEPSRYEDDTCYSSTPDGYWKSTYCKDELPFLCQITAGKPPIPKAYTGGCPNTSELWIPTDGNYCHIYESSRADWFTANIRCFRYGSYLISIHSLEDLEQIRKTMNVGLISVLIGLMRSEKGGFSWTDQTPVDFVNWEENQPENSDDNCVAMMADTLKWRVVPCLGKMYLLCSTKKVKEVDATPESAKYSDDSSSVLTTGAIAGLVVCSLLVILVIVVLGVLFLRPPLGRSRFRNPFRQHSVSYENALYNVDSSSMEFQEGFTSDSR